MDDDPLIVSFEKDDDLNNTIKAQGIHKVGSNFSEEEAYNFWKFVKETAVRLMDSDTSYSSAVDKSLATACCLTQKDPTGTIWKTLDRQNECLKAVQPGNTAFVIIDGDGHQERFEIDDNLTPDVIAWIKTNSDE